ncbi:MAG: hypothetical protein HY271_09310 [Deltaproteobacteria bacterium]|nr:hypothetical protein [Deltaproteobacteria bacterium]
MKNLLAVVASLPLPARLLAISTRTILACVLASLAFCAQPAQAAGIAFQTGDVLAGVGAAGGAGDQLRAKIARRGSGAWGFFRTARRRRAYARSLYALR